MQTILRLKLGTFTNSDDYTKPLSKIIIRKNTINSFILGSVGFHKKTVNIKKKVRLWSFLVWYVKYIYGNLEDFSEKRTLALLLFQDMINLYVIWRKIKGYPTRGQRTWSNGKTAIFNNQLLQNYRIKQFISAFGGKKRTNFNTLIQAEYNNKLWIHNFTSEWLQARKSLKKYLHKKTRNLQIDLISLSKGLTTGYKRFGNAAKQNKAKKQSKSATIGLPLFFSRFMYNQLFTRRFPFKIVVEQQQKKITKGVRKKKKFRWVCVIFLIGYILDLVTIFSKAVLI